MAMTQYLEDRDEFRLLENFHNYSGEEFSPKSYNNLSDDVSIGSSSKYKGKRPAKMQLPLKTFMINLRKYNESFPKLGILILLLVLKDFILVQQGLVAIGTM